MEELNGSSHYFDLASLDNLRQQAQADPNASLRQVAEQFEGIFLSMVLKSMRQANEAFKDEDSPFNSQTTQFYQEMHDSQLTSQLSGSGSLGLADLIVAQLGGDDSHTDASMLASKTNQTATMMPLERSVLMPVAKHSANERSGDETEAVATKTATETPVQQPLTFTQPDEFVQALLPSATEAGKKLGQDPHLLIAQAALETGWGQKILKAEKGQSSHNLFNIKADNRWSGEKTTVTALEYEDKIPVMSRSSFRVYDSLKASFDDYVDFLQQPRYQEAINAKDAVGFVEGLQQAGYATDPKYADKVLDLFQRMLQ